MRILAAYDLKEGNREEVAGRFGVSVGMVKKLLLQRRRIGDVRPRHRNSGRRPALVERHGQELRELLARKPDLTLEQIHQALGLRCTEPDLRYALERMGLTYKGFDAGIYF